MAWRFTKVVDFHTGWWVDCNPQSLWWKTQIYAAYDGDADGRRFFAHTTLEMAHRVCFDQAEAAAATLTPVAAAPQAASNGVSPLANWAGLTAEQRGAVLDLSNPNNGFTVAAYNGGGNDTQQTLHGLAAAYDGHHYGGSFAGMPHYYGVGPNFVPVHPGLVLPNLPALQELDLWGNAITDEGARLIFGQLASNPVLQKLNLRFNAIGDASMHALFVALKTAGSALRELDLWGNAVGDEGAKQIAEALRENVALEQLNLRENRVGNAGAEALAMTLQHHNKTLVTLNLRGNDVGSAAAEMLHAATTTQRRIEIIDLRANPRAPRTGLLVRSLAV